jgi:hypothetical protein
LPPQFFPVKQTITWNSFEDAFPKADVPFLAYDDKLKIYEVLILSNTTDGFIYTNMRGDIIKANPTHWKRIGRMKK